MLNTNILDTSKVSLLLGSLINDQYHYEIESNTDNSFTLVIDISRDLSFVAHILNNEQVLWSLYDNSTRALYNFIKLFTEDYC